MSAPFTAIPPCRRLLLVGDALGLPALLQVIPLEAVAGLLAASNRPEALPPLQALAQRIDKPLLIQPRFRSPGYQDFLLSVAAMAPDSLLCYSYAMIIRPDLLALLKGRAYNVHPSLLPKNRGPNPIQWAIIRGETQTGHTLHQMAEAVDAGPILHQQPVPIHLEDTWLTLRDRLNDALPQFLAESAQRLLCGSAMALPQDEAQATVNSRLTPQSPKIDWRTMTDLQVYNLIRAQVAPLAGAYCTTASGEILRYPEPLTLAQVALLRQSNQQAMPVTGSFAQGS
ncbi:MAG: formyltransferase family protein [Candidatus Melainabacteria bacterium]|nr:formyltransferase family protein [Candidatus Melainabacteria bacterium]